MHGTSVESGNHTIVLSQLLRSEVARRAVWSVEVGHGAQFFRRNVKHGLGVRPGLVAPSIFRQRHLLLYINKMAAKSRNKKASSNTLMWIGIITAVVIIAALLIILFRSRPKVCNISKLLNSKFKDKKSNCTDKLDANKSCAIECGGDGNRKVNVSCNEKGKRTLSGGCNPADMVLNFVHHLACSNKSTKLCSIIEYLQNNDVISEVQKIKPENVALLLKTIGICPGNNSKLTASLTTLFTDIKAAATGGLNDQAKKDLMNSVADAAAACSTS